MAIKILNMIYKAKADLKNILGKIKNLTSFW
jgi:hypothetical protein